MAPDKPTYARRRHAGQTTIWISTKAKQFILQEKHTPRESDAAVIDRFCSDVRRCRRTTKLVLKILREELPEIIEVQREHCLPVGANDRLAVTVKKLDRLIRKLEG